jgi:hypothetical protein
LFTFAHFAGTNPRFSIHVCGAGNSGERLVIGKEYLTRQAMTLLKFAKSSKDPNVSAALVDKAADLKSQLDETTPPPDLSPQAPDVEPTN